MPIHTAVAAGVPVEGLQFLPPPPAENSPDMERDKAAHAVAEKERGTARWEEAISYADFTLTKGIPSWFGSSLGVAITKETTPALYALVEATALSIGKPVKIAKEQYERVRPFMYFNVPGTTCAPSEEARLGASFPSGHAAIAWGLALVLSEISPERRDAIMRQGYTIGQSRIVCGVHWQSDVDTGRLLASVAVPQMLSDPDFQLLMAKAKAELAQLRQSNAK